MIQEYLVDEIVDQLDISVSDVNGDGIVSIMDATSIREYLDNKIEIIKVTISSNNSSGSTVAKQGDTITLMIETTGKIYNLNQMDIRIAGQEAFVKPYDEEEGVLTSTYIAELTLTEDVVNQIINDPTDNDLYDDGRMAISIRNYENISGERGRIIYDTTRDNEENNTYVILDVEAPTITSVEAKGYEGTSNISKTILKNGDTVIITVKASEEIQTNGVLPKLKIKFDEDGEERELLGTLSNDTLIYRYTVNEDNGRLIIISLLGEIIDIPGNQSEITHLPSNTNTNNIQADTISPTIKSVNIDLLDEENYKEKTIIKENGIIGTDVELDDGSIYKIGDINKDGNITEDDVDLIQKYLANIVEIDENDLKLADTDENEIIDVTDVTVIQQYLNPDKITYISETEIAIDVTFTEKVSDNNYGIPTLNIGGVNISGEDITEDTDDEEHTTIRYRYNTIDQQDGILRIQGINTDGSLYDEAGNRLDVSTINNPINYTVGGEKGKIVIDQTSPYVDWFNEEIGSVINGVMYTKYCDFINDNKIKDENFNESGEITLTLKDVYGNEVENYINVKYTDLNEMKLQDGEYYLELTDPLGNEGIIHFVVDNKSPELNVIYEKALDGHIEHVVIDRDIDEHISVDRVKLYKVNNSTLNPIEELTYNYNVDNIAPGEEITTYKIVATDYAGNETVKYFKVDPSDIEVENVSVTYFPFLGEDGKLEVKAVISSTEYLQELDGWTLSDDRKSLSKVYSTNTIETVTVEDLCGNTKDVYIKVTDIEGPVLDIERKDGYEQYVSDEDEIVLIISSQKAMKLDQCQINGKDVTVNNGTEYRNVYEVSVIVDSSMSEGNIVVSYTCTYEDENEGTKSGSTLTDEYIIDRTAPTEEEFTIVGYDKTTGDEKNKVKAEDIIVFTSIFSENIKLSEDPILKIRIGDGEEKEVTNIQCYNGKIIYTYTVTDEDEGELLIVSLDEKITDLANNELNVTKLNEDTGILIDKTAPYITDVEAYVDEEYIVEDNIYTNSGDTFVGSDRVIKFVVNTSEEIVGSEIPTLKIKIGDDEEISLTNGVIYNDKIIYTYLTDMDNGKVYVVSLEGGKLTDEAGNILDKTLPEDIDTKIYVDTKAPEVIANLAEGNTIVLSQEDLVYINDFIEYIDSSDLSGIKTTVLKLDDEVISGYKLSYVIARDGNWTLEVTDNVGNSSEYSFIIDTTLPVIKLNGEDQNNVESIDNIIIEITDENLDTIELYKNGQKVEFNYDIQRSIYESGSYRIVAKDKAGNITEKTFSVTRKMPTVNMYLGDTDEKYTPGTWTNKSVRVELSLENIENVSSIEYRTSQNGTWNTVGENGEVILSTTGEYIFEARTKYDNNKYSSITEEVQIKIDKVAPTIGDIIITTQEGTRVINDYYNGDLNISIPMGTDENSGVKNIVYIINNQENTSTLEIQRTINNSGIYEIEYFAIDNAGNESEHKTATIKIDKDSPVITYSDSNDNTITGEVNEELDYIIVDDEDIRLSEFTYFNQYVKLKFADSVSGINQDTLKLFKYDEQVRKYVEYTDMAVMRDGRYIVTVKDNVGHRASKGFVVDTTSPIVKINNDYPEVTVDNTIKNNYYNTDAEIDVLETGASVKVYKKGNDGSFTQEVRFLNQIHKITEDGIYKLVAKDGLENETIVYFTIDRQAPSMNTSVSPSTDSWINQDVTLTIEAQDELSGIKSISVNGIDVLFNNGVARCTIVANGNYEIVVKDNSGNNVSRTVTINNIDKTVPEITDITKNPESEATSVTLTVNAQDSLSGIDGYSWDNGSTWKTQNTYAVTENGTYTVIVKDKVGNESQRSIVVDNIKQVEDRYFRITNYTQKTEGTTNYVVGISTYTKVIDFKEYIQTNLDYTIYDRNENIVSNNDIIATNMVIRVSDGRQFVLVVRGDLNSDGKADISDLGVMASYLVGKGNLSLVYRLAGDITNNGVVDISDISVLAQAVTRNIKL